MPLEFIKCERSRSNILVDNGYMYVSVGIKKARPNNLAVCTI